jgi:hypothetical protein
MLCRSHKHGESECVWDGGENVGCLQLENSIFKEMELKRPQKDSLLASCCERHANFRRCRNFDFFDAISRTERCFSNFSVGAIDYLSSVFRFGYHLQLVIGKRRTARVKKEVKDAQHDDLLENQSFWEQTPRCNGLLQCCNLWS